MAKIAVGAFVHEANSFTPLKATKDRFRVVRGADIYDHLKIFQPTDGILTRLNSFGYDLVPTVFASSLPFGEVDKGFFLDIRDELIDWIADIGHLNAIALTLHGSMGVEEIGDGEGDLLSHLRSRFPKIPIVVALDLHAIVTEKMVDNADAFVGYRTAPHVDQKDTGERAAKLVRFALENDKKLAMGYQQIPMMLLGELAVTGNEPMKSMIGDLIQAESSDDVLSASFFTGFPPVDIPGNRASAVVITAGNRDKAVETAKSLARTFWDRRDEFTYNTEAYPAEEAITKAVQGTDFPVFISDMGDNPTAGSPEDNSNIVKALNEHPLVQDLKKKPLVAVIADAEACEKCRGKEGQEITLKLGGKIDSIYSKPLALSCRVDKIISRYTEKELGIEDIDIAIVTTGKIDIVVTSKRVGVTHPNFLRAVDDQFDQREIFVVKSGYLFDAFKDVAGRSILALTTGCADPVLSRLPYKNVRRPVFPLDKDFEFRV